MRHDKGPAVSPQEGRDDLLRKLRNVDDVERFGHALQNPRRDGLTDDSDQLVRIAAGIAVAGDTGRRERSQAAWRVAGQIEIRAVGTGRSEAHTSASQSQMRIS